MKQFLRYSFVALMAMVCGNVWAADITDELTNSAIGITGTSYSDWSGKSFTSNAVYAGNTAGNYQTIQMRTNNNNSGIVSTASGGKIKSVTIVWNKNTAYSPSAANPQTRSLEIYGSNTAYTAASDLYGDNKGTLLGTSNYVTDENNKASMEETITVTGDYAFIGIRSKSGALYLDEISIVWESTAATKQDAGLSFAETSVSAILGNSFTAPTLTNPNNVSVEYSSSSPEVATVNASTGAITLVSAGTTTITASVPESNTSYKGAASYVLSVANVVTIANAQAAEKGTAVCVEGTIVASAANGAVLYDGTDYIYYYNTANALAVGQKVRMIGSLGEYGGAKQLPNSSTITELGTETVTHPNATTLATTDFEAIVTAKVAERKYVTFEGALSISGNYFNLAIGSESAQGSLVKPKEDLSSLNGQNVSVTGYLMYVNNKYVYVVATEVKATSGVSAIKADVDANAPAYNVAGQKVAEGYKGLVIKGGKKVIQK